MEDQQLNRLAVACQRGNQDSFRVLVEALTRPLMAMAYRYTHDWETARDLTQETWLKVYESIQRYDPARPLRSWLLAIHRNGCLSHLRKAAVQRELVTEDEALARLVPADAAPDAQESLEREEFGAHLRSALAGLSESQRRVFSCVDMEQMGQAEAAQYLGMKFATLRTTLYFARKRLAGIIRGTEEVT